MPLDMIVVWLISDIVALFAVNVTLSYWDAERFTVLLMRHFLYIFYTFNHPQNTKVSPKSSFWL